MDGWMDGWMDDIYLNGVVSVVYRLRVVLEHEGLPGPVGQLSPRQVHEERLLGASRRGVEARVLPPVEGADRVLLEGVAVEGMGAVCRVCAQCCASWVGQHRGEILEGRAMICLWFRLVHSYEYVLFLEFRAAYSFRHPLRDIFTVSSSRVVKFNHVG